MNFCFFRHAVVTLFVGLTAITLTQASAVAQAPTLAQAPTVSAPVNLRVVGLYVDGKPTDTLQWTPVPGALRYNIYCYNNYTKGATGDFRTPIALGVERTIYQLPTARYVEGITYSVTAVTVKDGVEYESLASGVAAAQGAPSWWWAAPDAPTELKAITEMQNETARLVLTWKGSRGSNTYRVYRDGRLMASGVWGLSFFDADVTAGKEYRYTVVGVNTSRRFDSKWNPIALIHHTSQTSEPLVATVNATPVSYSSEAVKITKIVRNDDSATIHFAAVTGAKDYRAYVLTSNGRSHASVINRVYKYSGGGLSIEMNGLNPLAENRIQIEAVDKLGPFQTMDGEMSPGVQQSEDLYVTHINGLGDPSNIPQVIARSEVLPVQCKPFTLTRNGQDTFLENFRQFGTLVATKPSAALLTTATVPVAQLENDKWVIRNYNGDFASSRVFTMSNHFMDTLYDGGTPTGNTPMHNNATSLVMTPKATADMTGGKTLHITYEVDSHLSSRRWISVFVTPAEDELTCPNDEFFAQKFTNGKQSFLCSTSADRYKSSVSIEGVRFNEDPYSWFYRGDINGSSSDLDKRHRVHMYLSNTHLKIVEDSLDGSTPKVVRDTALPAKLNLGRVKVHFSHQFYHSELERKEDLIIWRPQEQYWINHRPFADERHWDNMGFEVLNTMPSEK
jgi:hypothetical protein